MSSPNASRALAVVALLAACGPSAEAKKTCEQAADRWVQCVDEMLGEKMAAQARAKRDIDACARDERTVQMYEKCLAAPTCETMVECMMGQAGATP